MEIMIESYSKVNDMKVFFYTELEEKMMISGAPAKETALNLLGKISAYFSQDEEALAVVEMQRQKLLGKRPCQLVKEAAERLGNDLYTKTGCETNV